MGYGTPNIDRIAKEGVLFTDHYAQPSCTAGRAALITGQYPIRSGMTTVGQPGSSPGLQAGSPTLAEILRLEGYRTGQFGKNLLRDRNEHLPTAHGFDEFFGNLFHLNTQEEAKAVNEPFFVCLNTSRMPLYTRIDDEWLERVEQYTSEADYHGAGMLQHDRDIGIVLDSLEDMGLAENTIVVYSTDNGPEHSSWPHGATTPFRGEKMTTYEGGVRVPLMACWPARIPAGTKLNGIQGYQDLFTTLAAAAGVDNVAEFVRKEMDQYIDGVNNLDYWRGQTDESSRNHIFHYYESKLTAVRMGPWKFHFSTKEDCYANVVPRTVPLVFNIRMDPYESYDSPDSYGHLMQKFSWLIQPMGVLMRQHLESLSEYPPVQGGASFDMSNVVEDYINTARQ